jgi:LytS/YehU family sensor histidine kinase
MKKKDIMREFRDVLILTVVGFGISWIGLGCPDCRESPRQFIIMASFTSLLWILLWKGNEFLGKYISTKISWIHFPIQRFLVGTAATVAYTFGVMYSLTAIYERYFNKDIGDGAIISVVISIAISVFMHGWEFLLSWRKAQILAEQYQKESLSAKYDSLRNQVNPHFLFNSLNALSNLIYEDEEKAEVFITQLSDVYGYVIQTQEKETIPLEEELRFLQSYIYLQQIRFGDKLLVNMKLDGLKTEVAPLALQMLIENAIKHNIISVDDPLTITISRDGSFLVVENNLQKKNSYGEDSAGVGLENIYRRYEILSSVPVQVEETTSYFRVKLPLLNHSAK